MAELSVCRQGRRHLFYNAHQLIKMQIVHMLSFSSAVI